MSKKKPVTVTHNNRLNISEDEGRGRAKKALALAKRSVKDLAPFRTPLGLLADAAVDGIDIDEFLFAVEAIAKAQFGGSDAISDEMYKAFGVTSGRDERIEEIYSCHLNEQLASTLAAFTIGLAWGRLEGGVR